MLNKKIEPIVSPIESIKKKESVCIIGFAPSWDLAPFGDKNIDFWGINELYIYLNEKKVDPKTFAAWFEIHDIKNSPSKQAPKHQKFLKTCGIPLITQQHWEDYPTSIAYPRDEVKKMVNENFIEDDKHSGFSDYSNQISWMIALAIYLGYKEISVYGVDMAQTSEYAFQRASCQFFIALAAGKGIKLKIPRSCELLKCGADYGFQSDNKGRFDAKKRIEGHNKALHQVRLRQAEIDYYKDKLLREQEQKFNVIDAQLEEIQKELNRLEAGNMANTSVVEFLNSMPNIANEIFAKKATVIQNTNQMIQTNNTNIEALRKQVIELKTKKDKIERDVAINLSLLEEEYMANKMGTHELKGNIKANEHNLNNNLV